MVNWRSANPTSVHCIDWISMTLAKLSFEHPNSFPDFSDARRLFLFSDYSSCNQVALYSFLITSEKNLALFNSAISSWRYSQNLNRRFDYKKLGDRVKSRLLHKFLDHVDAVPALMLTISIDNRIGGLLTGSRFVRDAYKAVIPFDERVPDRIVEQVFRCAAFAAILVNGLCSPGQDLVWMSDDDDMFANDNLAVRVKGIVETIFDRVTTMPMGSMGYTIASKAKSHSGAQDLLSVCDLSCGYYVSHLRETPKLIVPVPRYKDAVLGWWLSRHNLPMRKVYFALSRNTLGGPSLDRKVLISPYAQPTGIIRAGSQRRPF